ncbi:hypothetical protein ACOSQ3_016855 [Xanthoceras sorbifolium]
MIVGSSSISALVDNNKQTIPPTFTIVIRVLWYSNTPAPSSNENYFGSSSQQDVSQSTSQHSQQCSEGDLWTGGDRDIEDESFCCHGCLLWTVG